MRGAYSGRCPGGGGHRAEAHSRTGPAGCREDRNSKDGGYDPLIGVKFDILRWDRTSVATNCSSLDSGCFWIGDLPFGTYYLHETEKGGAAVSLWYTVTVDVNGTRCSVASTTEPTP